MQDMTPAKPSEPEKRDPNWREGQEEIDASKAPLMEHLIELRQRLIYTLIGIGVAFVVCFAFASELYNILVQPYKWARGEQETKLIFTAPQEFFFTKLKLALFGAVCLAFPIIANQLYKFVAPGLYKNERQAFVPYLVATPILFTLGALCVYFLVMPLALTFFLGMEQTTGDVKIVLEARVSEYLSLIMTMILGFGICFQLPVILSILAKAGVVDGQSLREFRRYAIIAITAVSAVLSPPDPFSMIAMMLPTLLLYEASILIVDRINPPERPGQETKPA
jgi:sec-independent protein translocase protein TatC